MTYTDTTPARFLSRESRFTAMVQIHGQACLCHLKNTARLEGLLPTDAEVFVQRAANPARATQWDLIAVRHDGCVVNIDSTAPNRIFAEWLPTSGLWGGPQSIRPETRLGASRLDFYVDCRDGQGFIEVKGVTLWRGGAGFFPDAPTTRGTKHLTELAAAVRQGYRAMVAFIVQVPGLTSLRPADDIDPAFGAMLRSVAAQGVELLALACEVSPECIRAVHDIPVDIT